MIGNPGTKVLQWIRLSCCSCPCKQGACSPVSHRLTHFSVIPLTIILITQVMITLWILTGLAIDPCKRIDDLSLALYFSSFMYSNRVDYKKLKIFVGSVFAMELIFLQILC